MNRGRRRVRAGWIVAVLGLLALVLVLLACLGLAHARATATPGLPVRTVWLSPGEWQAALDVPTDHLFLANRNLGRVEMRDAVTGDLLRRVTVGFLPTLIGIDPGSDRLLVLNAAGDDTAPPGPGPVCSARTQSTGPDAPACRAPAASLSIIPMRP